MDASALHRVHIIGGMGTGKTWLAQRLASTIGAEAHCLDHWIDIPHVAAQEAWVTEGIFLWGVEPLLQRADAIVWLDLPYRIALPRVVWRHASLSARRRNPYKGLRLLWRFALGSRHYWQKQGRSPTGPEDYDALSRAQTITTLEPFAFKLVTLRTQREVVRWMKGVTSRRADSR